MGVSDFKGHQILFSPLLQFLKIFTTFNYCSQSAAHYSSFKNLKFVLKKNSFMDYINRLRALQ